MNKCDCWGEKHHTWEHMGVCYGTKEMDACTCGGNKAKCDFYQHVRDAAAESDYNVDALQMALGIRRYCKKQTDCYKCVFCTHTYTRLCMLTMNDDVCPEDWNLPEGGEAHDDPGR